MTKPYDDESEWMALKILVGASGDIVKIEKEEMNRLIAYVEELREKIVVRDAELEYTHNSIDKMYAESIEFSKAARIARKECSTSRRKRKAES